ncbi:DUF2785 domain-containing protein [Paenisporosarcina indica]|uniref:DUF2785 domain-containing protein n=1 Tax=Paenisporosarcina indica TaxID=650093 RepID=UPI00094F62A6|nr:DUF2785 domain-containing protein [Paenisporosarcina indica]
MTELTSALKNILNGKEESITKDILNDMIENIGSTDPVLRDQLIYSAFCKLVDRLSKQQLEYVLNLLLYKQLLTLDIEKPMTDSVFTRSFTALFFAAIVENDATNQIIDAKIIRKVMDEAHEYMAIEQDLRGFVEHKGWAHAAAHGADLLDSLIKHPLSTEEDAKKVLENIFRLISIAEGYKDDEEERIARAFVTLTKHHLTESLIIDWLLKSEQFFLERKASYKGDLQPYYTQLAFKNFLKSSYFLLEKEAIQKPLQEAIKKIVVRLIY